MILPIVAYGDPVLRKECEELGPDYPKLKSLIANMYETMYASHGVGLAAPQVGLPIRLFIVDASGFAEDEKDPLNNFKRTFINAYIIEETGTPWEFEEGCLSIPGIRENVKREPSISVEYMDENFNLKEEKFEGIVARIIQHEHDHIDGKLFIDYLSSLRKKLLRGKLNDITRGKVDVDYKMRFPKR